MKIRFRPDSKTMRYDVDLGQDNCSFWAYPDCNGRDECVISPNFPTPCERADPPSHELRTLIEAAAPWYVILDKLTEEYPQWESHFAAAAEWERQRLTHPTPESASARS